MAGHQALGIPFRRGSLTPSLSQVVEAQFISLPPLNKCTSIGHDILPLMAIDIHPVPSTLVSPVQLLQPAGCSLFSRSTPIARCPSQRKSSLHLGTLARDRRHVTLPLTKPLLGLFDHSELRSSLRCPLSRRTVHHACLAQASDDGVAVH